MPVSNIDPSAEESQTQTMEYGRPTDAGPNVSSPTIHELATQQVEEAFGPDAHNNPTFDARVKDVEAQMLESIEKTKDL